MSVEEVMEGCAAHLEAQAAEVEAAFGPSKAATVLRGEAQRLRSWQSIDVSTDDAQHREMYGRSSPTVQGKRLF